jgi:hypothetical protein
MQVRDLTLALYRASRTARLTSDGLEVIDYTIEEKDGVVDIKLHTREKTLLDYCKPKQDSVPL